MGGKGGGESFWVFKRNIWERASLEFSGNIYQERECVCKKQNMWKNKNIIRDTLQTIILIYFLVSFISFDLPNFLFRNILEEINTLLENESSTVSAMWIIAKCIWGEVDIVLAKLTKLFFLSSFFFLFHFFFFLLIECFIFWLRLLEIKNCYIEWVRMRDLGMA